MKKMLIAALAGIACVATAVPASAQYRDGQYRDSDRDGRPDRREWNRDRDRDGRPDQFDRHDNRRDGARMRYYGGRYGYDGYRGHWRAGQRYPNYNSRRYVINDYGRYGLQAPWRGYRYYRDDSGDIVMAAIGTGLIGLIVGGALAGR